VSAATYTFEGFLCLPLPLASFEKAAGQLGLTITKDANDPNTPASAFTYFDRTISATGRRWSVFQAYLDKAIALERKDRLKICTGVVGSKLDVDKVSGVVKGVHFRPAGHAKLKDGKTGKDLYAKVRREVIICSGAITTPQLLLLSGVGPAADLKQHDIPLVVDQPLVGAELRDHYAFPVEVELPQNETLSILNNPLVFIWEFLKWLFLGTGILADMTTPSSAFIRTASVDQTTMTIRHDPDTDAADQHGIPDIEVMHTNIDCIAPSFGGPSLTSMFTTLVQPFSRGRITLASADPADPPRVEYPMLTDPRDWETLRLGLKFTMRYADEICGNVGLPFPAKLAYAPGMDLKVLDEAIDKVRTLPQHAYGTGLLSYPLRRVIKEGVDADADISEKTALLASEPSPNWQEITDEEIKAYAQRVGATSLHFGCTCPIGLTAKEGVVDQRLKVFGLRNLRIADASVFPRLPSSHTMAPTIVVAERCADFIKRDWAEKKSQ
jgi:choline dehydrogenase-like flavoprotein